MEIPIEEDIFYTDHLISLRFRVNENPNISTWYRIGWHRCYWINTTFKSSPTSVKVLEQNPNPCLSLRLQCCHTPAQAPSPRDVVMTPHILLQFCSILLSAWCLEGVSQTPLLLCLNPPYVPTVFKIQTHVAMACEILPCLGLPLRLHLLSLLLTQLPIPQPSYEHL